MNSAEGTLVAPGVAMIVRAGGRRVFLRRYGMPGGSPVFYFHGWPSSSLEACLVDDAARSLGVELAAPDRPGIGRSDMQDGRTLADWPATLAEIADALQWPAFRIMAVSGGAPYGWAAAHALPDRVKALAIVCGAPPLAEIADHSRLLPIYKMLLAMYRRSPQWPLEFLRMAAPLTLIQPPRWAIRLLNTRTMPKPDQDVLRDPSMLERFDRSTRAAFDHSAHAVYVDGEVNIQPYPFSLESIRVPVSLWHGREDRNFHWSYGELVAARVRGCRATFVDGEGHFSLQARRSPEILEQLIATG